MRIGAYRLGAVLGEGAMGVVHAAVDARGRDVAIKLLPRGSAALHAREIDALERLDHPHIVRLLDAGTTRDRRPYLVMPRIDGAPITARTRSRAATLRLFADACDALAHAHARGIVHCDLKPTNLLVTADEHVMVLDFGIARPPDDASDRRARTGTSRVTSEYASPEQLHAGAITPASDVYALGCVLYEALTGKPPHSRTLRVRLATTRAVRPPGITRAIDEIVLRALAEEPDERPTAAELARELRACAEKRKRRGGPRRRVALE